MFIMFSKGEVKPVLHYAFFGGVGADNAKSFFYMTQKALILKQPKKCMIVGIICIETLKVTTSSRKTVVKFNDLHTNTCILSKY